MRRASGYCYNYSASITNPASSKLYRFIGQFLGSVSYFKVELDRKVGLNSRLVLTEVSTELLRLL